MNEENSITVESGTEFCYEASSTVETVVYTEQLDNLLAVESAQFALSCVFFGLLLVLLISSVLRRYL